ncbi:MAG: FAD-binding oxidoreductase [Synechococcus sp.]|nr:FAD-binding oxidoreductase [Synechococcus sp.]
MEPNLQALQAVQAELSGVEGLDLLSSPADIERFSRDAYDYSPVLEARFRHCRAQLVVRPKTLAAVMAVAAACAKALVPLTLRGSGTGNYGQCVPLQGGVVMLMGELRSIRDIHPESGAVEVECGCLLKDLDSELAQQGRQLRLMPSTWRSASVGGFIAGGSGGIGSVRWGFLRDPGHLLGLEVVTVEPQPRRLRLNGTDAEAINHAYGTNGIITALTLSTAARVDWQEVCIDCADWPTAVALTQRCQQAAIDLFLCTLLDQRIVTGLPSWSGPANALHRLLLLVSPDALSTVQRLARAAGAQCHHLGDEASRAGNGLRELSWNHTTLHMRQQDPGWTYLQMLLPQPEMAALETLSNAWGDTLLWHLEGVRQAGQARLAALPLVRWQGEDALERLISQCRALGAVIFNPHVITVEDGGLGIVDADQVAAKGRHDPMGLLNPGKLRGWLQT